MTVPALRYAPPAHEVTILDLSRHTAVVRVDGLDYVVRLDRDGASVTADWHETEAHVEAAIGPLAEEIDAALAEAQRSEDAETVKWRCL